MTTGEKILIGIVVIATIITGIIVGISKKSMNDNADKQKSEMDSMVDYIDGVGQNKIEANTVDNEIKENETTEENKNNTVTNNSVIGKEEQESKQENTEEQNRQKAIELAKEEWAISVNSYNFEAELQSDGTYNVSVINKTNRTVITIYNVNVKTGTVTE